MSTHERNVALVRRYFEEVWVKGNLPAVDEFMAPITWSTPSLQARGQGATR